MQRSACRARRSSSLPESACASGSAFLQVNPLVSFSAAHSGEALRCSAFACARRRFLSERKAASSSFRVGAVPVLRSHWSRFASIAAMREVAVSTLLSRWARSEEHTSELQSLAYLVCRLLLEKKKNQV